jgi:hypothetical protein
MLEHLALESFSSLLYHLQASQGAHPREEKQKGTLLR